jgi:hypothetical protein
MLLARAINCEASHDEQAARLGTVTLQDGPNAMRALNILLFD